jgi:hypothetical protein
MKKLITEAAIRMTINTGLNIGLILAKSNRSRKNSNNRLTNMAVSKRRLPCPVLFRAVKTALKNVVFWTTARYSALRKARIGTLS